MEGKNLRRVQRSLIAGVAAAGLMLTGCSVTGGGGGGEAGDGTGEINALFMKQAGYSEDDYAQIIADFEEENGGDITVNPTFVSYEALHDKIVTSAPAGTYDVVLIDVIWPAEFASKGIVADLGDKFPGASKDELLSGVIPTAEYQDKFYGVPNGPSTKLFFYNEDMISEVGATAEDLDTWDGVLATAKEIKEAGISEYPIAWSWAQAEALICDYAQLLGAFDGEFTNDDGELVINNEQGVAALEWMKQTIDDGLTNPASTTFLEDDVSKALAQGETAFGLNWDSTMRDLQDPEISTIADAAGVLATPKGPNGARPGVNGAMAYSITATSVNQDAAWQFIDYMTSEETQEKYVQSSQPSWKASYEKPEVIDVNPEVFAVSEEAYADSILRPAVPNYSTVSQIIQVELQNALLGKKTPQEALDDAVEAANAELED
ncbi:extracellular solute-binding protein [Leucobacter sp. USHLN153]|uniref:extracellular solute-binding protein n=1 Tax=Leucobacter sp. USHLN153 TaxID=3081268 RepID=UPI00301A8DA1